MGDGRGNAPARGREEREGIYELVPFACFAAFALMLYFVSLIARAFFAAGRSQHLLSHVLMCGHLPRSSVSARKSAPATFRSPTEKDGPASHSDLASAVSRTSKASETSFQDASAISGLRS